MNYKIRVVVGIAALVLIAVFGVILPILRSGKEPAVTGAENSNGYSVETSAPSSTDTSMEVSPEPSEGLAWDWPDTTDGEIELDPASDSDFGTD
jgi:hypothetical protein